MDSRPLRRYVPAQTNGYDFPTFNAFLDVPNVGDEQQFMTGKIVDAPDGFYSPVRKVLNGNRLLLRMYIHNGADPSLNDSGAGVARGTHVRVALPVVPAEEQAVVGTIAAPNAVPDEIQSTLLVTAESPFLLDYEPGSASITSNSVDSAPVGDAITNEGVLIGDREPGSGEVFACFDNVLLLTVRAVVRFV